MSRRNKIIVTIVAVILVLAILIFVFWWFNRPKDIQVDVVEPNTNIGLEVQGVLPENLEELEDIFTKTVPEQNLEADIKAIAFTFAERFGSYSNQGNFSNLTDLKSIMSVKMKASVDAFIASQPRPDDSTPYFGVTTNAVSAEVVTIDKDLGRAELVVVTQRQEAKFDTSNPRTYYQSINVKLVDSDSGWKIDSADWL